MVVPLIQASKSCCQFSIVYGFHRTFLESVQISLNNMDHRSALVFSATKPRSLLSMFTVFN